MKRILTIFLTSILSPFIYASGVDVEGNPITGSTLFGDIDGRETTFSNIVQDVMEQSGATTIASNIAYGIVIPATNAVMSDACGYTDASVMAVVSRIETNYYTRAETDEAVDRIAAYYITLNAEGGAFPNLASLTNATVYYSGGGVRVPTRNDYAVVLADETHGGAEWRYIYTVPSGSEPNQGQWEAQYPIETNDYEALANRPAIDGTTLTKNSTADGLGLLKTTAISATNPTFSNAVLSVGLGVDTNTVAAINALVEAGDELPIGGVTTVGALLLAIAAAVAVLRRSKLSATSAAPAFSTEQVYTKGDHVTHDGTLYECVSSVQPAGQWDESKWTPTDMTSPDATLDIMSSGRLRVVAADGETLWAQGYDLASESSVALSGDRVNYFVFPATTAAAFSDATAYAIGDRVVYDGKVYKFTAAHAAGAWIGTDAEEDPDIQAFTMPSPVAGKVGDFGLDVDNGANTVEVCISLDGLDVSYSVVVPKGESLTDMLTFASGEMAELYFTMTAFKVNGLPTWTVAKRAVEAGV